MNTQKAIRLLLIVIPTVLILSFIWHGLTPFLSPLIICLGILLVRAAFVRSGFFNNIFTRPRPPIPYYQPSQQTSPGPDHNPTTDENEQPEHSYEQGYQAQVKYEEAGQPKQDNPSDYEQPEAQYPEQLPPMTSI
jgi:hypothetical protein